GQYPRPVWRSTIQRKGRFLMRIGRTLACCLLLAACRTGPPNNPQPQPQPQPPPQTQPQLKSDKQVTGTLEPTHLTVGDKLIELKPGTTIQFKSSSDELLPESDEILKEVAVVMRRDPDMRIRVEGHTDNNGKPEDNKALSQKRAAAVKAF